ncbi:hypothetical protein DPMN_112196 [Dreissena polymorpha]|uniref:Homeobox domain-containing protein n=1 Tax=Dreissena polymorpha TaxID=45954 RepID=A0A9D4KGL3_DREPO|nr:hypothetical protein DPMN_112196 [Dreissena polymorpha]
MDGYFCIQFPHHLQDALGCTNNTTMFSQPPSSVRTTGGRFHPYLGRSNYFQGYFSSAEASNQGGSLSCYQPNACAYPAKYQQQQPTTDEAFSTMKTSRETDFGLNQHMAGDILQLSTLKTLQDVCGLGIATASLANAARLNENVLSSTIQGSVKRTFENQNEIEGAIFYHPFYNRRRRAAAPEEGMTRTRDKYRVVYTEKQRKGLEQAYEENKFITMETRTKLSKEIDLSDRQVNKVLNALIQKHLQVFFIHTVQLLINKLGCLQNNHICVFIDIFRSKSGFKTEEQRNEGIRSGRLLKTAPRPTPIRATLPVSSTAHQ